MNTEIIPEVNQWNQEFWDSLGEIWGVYPTKPVYMIITKDNFGPEMGFTSPYSNYFEVMVNLRYPLSETRGIIAHELMHVFQFSWMEKYGRTMPLWIMEGLATWYGGKMGYYPSSLGYNPFLFQSVDPLKYENYPNSDLKLEEYYAEVYALFTSIDKKVNLQSALPGILQNVKNGQTWEEAFSKVLGENFDMFYSNWRKEIFIYTLLGLIGIWGIWISLPAFLISVFLVNFLRSPRAEVDNIDENEIEKLEKLYGKEYWKDGDKDIDEKDHSDGRTE